jgi:hypothetical protein
MFVDKGKFLLALGGLAAGGAGGYYASDHHVVDRLRAPYASNAPAESPGVANAMPGTPAVGAAVPAPACDDMTGAPAACPPPPYSADESGCAPVAKNRCEDFKASMKPRIAEQAVACVLALTPGQQCDPKRVDLCGHNALMNACTPPPRPGEATGGATAASTTTAATGNDDLGSRCRSIAQSCPGASERDCEATLAGMTAVGRERMSRCMSAHCSDKGLVGCEAKDVQ